MKTKIFVLALLAVLVLSPAVYAQTAEELYIKGIELNISGEHVKAMEYFDKGIKLDSNNYKIWTEKGALLLNERNFEGAMKCFDKSLEIKEYFMTYFLKGSTLEKLGQFYEAIKYLKKATDTQPADRWVFVREKGFKAVVYYMISRIYSKMNSKEKMLINLNKSIELWGEGLRFINDVKKDSTFKAYWDDPDFIELITMKTYHSAKLCAKMKYRDGLMTSLKEAIKIQYYPINFKDSAKNDETFEKFWNDPYFIELTKETFEPD